MNDTINRQALADRINALTGLDSETKSQLLELLHERKRYGLVWEDKPEAVEERMRKELPVLKEVKERAIISDSPDAPNHILIEGDNLEALTTLSYTHEGKIDVIYIDPPYNTGNKDFIYNDSYVDSDDDYRHSKWLSFMAKRLKIARRLLSEKGVIFISIDDNEQANLKLLCDEVFGEKNFVSDVCVKMSHLSGMKMSHKDKKIPKIKEFLLLYCKECDNSKFNTVYVPGEWDNVLERYTGYIENHDEDISCWKRVTLASKIKGMSSEEALKFKLANANNIFRTAVNDSVADTPKDSTFRWVVSKTGLTKCIYNAEEVLLASSKMQKFGNKLLPAETIGDIWTDIGINNLHNEGGVQYPNGKKPIKLIERIIKMATDTNSIILDFFAGSGTTLQASLMLNNEDNGHRQCILVQCSENNGICESITYSRCKNVIRGYMTMNNVYIEGLHNNTLRYYRTDFVCRESSQTAKRELMAAATDLLCIKNDIYTEKDTFGGKRFRKDVVRFFGSGERRMLIIYNAMAIGPVVDIISEMTVAEPIIVYIFSLNDYAMDADFETVADKVSLCALPDAILRAYRRVLPKKRMED